MDSPETTRKRRELLPEFFLRLSGGQRRQPRKGEERPEEISQCLHGRSKNFETARMLHENRMRSLKTVFVLLAALISSSALAQGYRGTDFWICFPQNAVFEQGIGIELKLYIASDFRTNGYVEPQDDTTKIPFAVESGAAISLTIDSTYQLLSSSKIERKSLHVTCDHPISLYV